MKRIEISILNVKESMSLLFKLQGNANSKISPNKMSKLSTVLSCNQLRRRLEQIQLFHRGKKVKLISWQICQQ